MRATEPRHRQDRPGSNQSASFAPGADCVAEHRSYSGPCRCAAGTIVRSTAAATKLSGSKKSELIRRPRREGCGLKHFLYGPSQNRPRRWRPPGTLAYVRNALTISVEATFRVRAASRKTRELGLFGRRLCSIVCAPARHLQGKFRFALNSLQRNLSRFEILSAALLRPSNASSFAKHWLGEAEIGPTLPTYSAYRSARCAIRFKGISLRAEA